MAITLKVTDMRKGRNPNKYSLTVLDGCTVAQLLTEIGDGAPATVTMGKSKSALDAATVLEDGDTLTVRV